jgi:tetratricopeptide (TPR) repeat protein
VIRPVLLLIAPLLALVSANPGSAQSGAERVPKRPELPADRDSNSSRDYFFYGASQISKRPERAAAAFYWAARLDPAWADPLYGQYIASLVAQPWRVIHGYLIEDDVIRRDPLILSIDAIEHRALMRNPFVDRRFDGVLLDTWANGVPNGQAALLELRSDYPRLAGWMSYTYGNFQEAAVQYRRAIKRYPDNPWLQFERVLPFVAMGRNDSALTAMRTSLSGFRESDSSRAGSMYRSRAFHEFSIGVLFERGELRDSATAAYERALLDDVTFYPAHLRLARMRLASGDTARALREYADATALNSGDPVALYEFGALSMAAGRVDSAVVLLKQASTVEPYFAQPHYALGVIYQNSGFVEEAAEEYGVYLRLVPRAMTDQIATVRRRIEGLTGTPAKP